MPAPQDAVWLSQAIPEFVAYKRQIVRSAWRHEAALQQVLKTMGDVPLQSITPRWVYDYQARRLRDGVAPSTVNREVAYLSSLLTWAVRRELIPDNPCRKVEKLKEPPPRNEYLRPDEIRRLLSTPTTPHLRMAFLLTLTTGLRRGELLRLRRDDILPTDEIVIRHSKNGRARHVPVPAGVLAELQAYMMTFPQADGRVFPWRGMERRSGQPTGFKTAWWSWLRRAGVRRVRWHDLRHTFAAYYVSHTGNLRELQAILGHSSPYMALRYGHYVEEYRERIRRQIGESFASVLGSDGMAENWQKTSGDFSTKHYPKRN